jgi:uncharacterized protein YpmB
MGKQLIVTVPEDEHQAVKVAAAKQGLTMTEVVRGLLALWLSGKVKVSKPK